MDLLWYLLLGAGIYLLWFMGSGKEHMISEVQKEQEAEVEQEAKEEEEGNLSYDSGFAGAPSYDLL